MDTVRGGEQSTSRFEWGECALGGGRDSSMALFGGVSPLMRLHNITPNQRFDPPPPGRRGGGGGGDWDQSQGDLERHKFDALNRGPSTPAEASVSRQRPCSAAGTSEGRIPGGGTRPSLPFPGGPCRGKLIRLPRVERGSPTVYRPPRVQDPPTLVRAGWPRRPHSLDSEGGFSIEHVWEAHHSLSLPDLRDSFGAGLATNKPLETTAVVVLCPRPHPGHPQGSESLRARARLPLCLF